jgi:dTDP-4-dehydrorhamnose 3,5-epimerase
VIFTPLKIPGAFIIEPEILTDERGFFARMFCEDEFAARGLQTYWPQSSISFNACRSTLRGMHFQCAPREEIKLVRCTSGAVQDVIIDLRPDSPTWKQWCDVELSAANHRILYIPKGCAHGFLTLADNTELFYQISEIYDADCVRGVRYDDPAFGIRWATEPDVITDRDRHLPDYA